MTDRYETFSPGLGSPAVTGFDITPHDSQDLPERTRAIYIGDGGDLTLTFADGAPLSFINLAAGTVLPVRATSVKATGTSAANLIGLV